MELFFYFHQDQTKRDFNFLSMQGIIKYAKNTDRNRLIIGTEIGILHRLRKENPDKEFIPVTEKGVCPNMKRIDLLKILKALETMEPQIDVPEKIRIGALASVEKMLQIK